MEFLRFLATQTPHSNDLILILILKSVWFADLHGVWCEKNFDRALLSKTVRFSCLCLPLALLTRILRH